MTTPEFESILTDLRALVDFPKVGRESGLIADGNVLVPLERLAVLVEGVDKLRAQCSEAEGEIARLGRLVAELEPIEQRARDMTRYSDGGRTGRQAAFYILGEVS